MYRGTGLKMLNLDSFLHTFHDLLILVMVVVLRGPAILSNSRTTKFFRLCPYPTASVMLHIFVINYHNNVCQQLVSLPCPRRISQGWVDNRPRSPSRRCLLFCCSLWPRREVFLYSVSSTWALG